MFETREYEWSDVSVVLANHDVIGLRGVSYSSSQEKEALYAKGNKPHGIQRGNISYSGTIRLLQSELIALQEAAGGSVLNITTDVVVAYGNPASGSAKHTDLIRGVEFTEEPKSLNQNDKFMEIELPFIAIDVVNNYE